MAVMNAEAAAFEQEVVFKECRRNHAASLGKVSCDGCCEFLGGGGENNARDDMLCAACNCHRNFHHQYTIYIPVAQSSQLQGENNNILNKTTGTTSSLAGSHVQPIAMVVNGGGNNPVPKLETAPRRRRRRKRTVFTAEQKSRMTRFAAERLGWKPRKADKEEIERFCLEMGITRRMFLVWVSNNRRKAMEKNTTPEN